MSRKKEQLLALKKELSQRVNKIDSDLHSRHTSTKFSDQVVDRQNDDVLLNLKYEAQFELQQIDRALIRMKNGEYGICEKCHSEISDGRLDALPYATLCESCAP